MISKYLKLMLIFTMITQASPKLFSSIGDKMEVTQVDCSTYQKFTQIPKKIKKRCKTYNSKVNRAFRYGYKLDPNVENGSVDYDMADKYHALLQNLEEDRVSIINSINKEVNQARQKSNFEYYKFLTKSNQANLNSTDYDFMEEHKGEFKEHSPYIEYEKEQAKIGEMRLKREQERLTLLKRQEEKRLEEMRIEKEKEEIRFKEEQERVRILVMKVNQKIKQNKTCKEFIVLHSASRLAQQYGKSVKWIYATGKKIYLWQKPRHKGKGSKVGEMGVGSHARIVSRSGDDYEVISPLDKSTGWVNKMQIASTQYQDINTNIKCTPFAEDSIEAQKSTLNYTIVNEERQRKGGSMDPLLPPKYTLLIAKVALVDDPELNKNNTEATLNKILSELKDKNSVDAITVFLYSTKGHIIDERFPFGRIEWWPKNHSLSRKNHTNIINKGTYKTEINISLPQKIKGNTRVSTSKKKEIYKAKAKSELQAIRDADRKYDVVYQWREHMEEINRLTDKYAKQICKKYKISNKELSEIGMEGVMGNW
ncbi:MAG: hypothetical protein U9O64_04750 [Campylobacterota bacterium]|nr:hypothetical protein [Campylobacterota bacterium]